MLSVTPKLVAFDLDGTLTESKQSMEAPIGELLRKLLEKMPVAIMSGASFEQFKKQFLPGFPLGVDFDHLYLFPDNAAQSFSLKNGVWGERYNYLFTDGERRKILEAFEVALGEVGLSEAQGQTWGERIEDRGAQFTFSALGQKAPLYAKRDWHGRYDNMRNSLSHALAKSLPEFSVEAGGLTSVDVTRKGMTKAYGIQELSKLTDIPISDMLYIGDALEEGGNDAVVKETGIPTLAVSGPEETVTVIEEILARSSPL